MNLKPNTHFTITVITLALTFTFPNCGSERSDQAQAPAQEPLPVPVASPIQKKITLTETFTGRFVANETVEIRSRVSGYIQKIHFKEGEYIREGQAIFSIDPAIYDADLAMSNARVPQIEKAV